MHPEQLELSGIFYFVHISITNNKGNFIMNLKIFVYKTGKPISEIKQIVEKAIKEAQILLPSIEEQAKIGAFFSAIDTLLTLHQRE